MIAEIVAQVQRSESLLARAQKAAENVRGLRSGDRVFTPLIESAVFSQGVSPSANVVFNVPADADFWAYRLLLYPQSRVIDPVNGTPPEVVYRSCQLTYQPYTPGIVDPAAVYTDFNNCVDGRFAFLYQGKELQNIDTPWSAAYAGPIGRWVGRAGAAGAPGVWGAASQTPGGFVFDVPFFIPRSKSLTLRLTPTYLGVRTIEETIPGPTTIVRQNEYKIVAVLEGEKKVAAFR